MGWLWMCLGVARDKSARRIGGRVSSETYLAPQYDPTKTPRIEDFLGAGCDISEKYLTGGQKGARRCVSEYGPYWGYAEDHMGVEDFVSIEFPRAPGARKSFSELLIETDTLDKGPLALAAIAAAAERAVRSSKLQPDGASKIVTLEAARTEPAAVSKRDQQPLPSIASLSKDHLEASNAVAAFRESRRQSTLQQNSSYISTLFRSSRKRSLPTRSRSFQRPLSPVPEVLSLEEELRNRRKSDVSASSMKPPSSLPATTSSKQQQDSLELDDYVLVDRAPEIISDAATSSIDARISSSSPEAASQDDATSSSPLQDHTTSSSQHTTLLPLRDASSSVPEWDASSSVPEWDASSSMPEWDASSSMPEWDASSSMLQSDARSSATKSEGQHEDESLLRTPVRDPLVTPEVFISPKTTPTAELNFTRVMDMEPEERLIFGSLADHWEAAWATKRPAWDGKGIPNSTNKYREDQKVMWHAAPFEERLAQALASQQDSRPRRRNSFNGRTSRLAASRSDTSLQAH